MTPQPRRSIEAAAGRRTVPHLARTAAVAPVLVGAVIAALLGKSDGGPVGSASAPGWVEYHAPVVAQVVTYASAPPEVVRG